MRRRWISIAVLIPAIALEGCGILLAANDDPPAPPPPSVDASAPDDAAGGELPDEGVPGDGAVENPDRVCNGAPDCIRVVFVTSATTIGTSLGGLSGADNLCEAHANASKIARVKTAKFRAWLSDDKVSASAHAGVTGTRPYVTPAGTIIAVDFAGFASIKHKAKINIDESGALETNVKVWTGAPGTGGISDHTCNNWSALGGSTTGTTGSSDAIDGKWSDDGSPSACISTPAHLYCVEY